MYTAPVRSYPPNNKGLFDVIGNVFEYCERGEAVFPPDSAGIYIFGRGGSCWCSENTCSFYNLIDIGRMVNYGSFSNQGFRVVKDP